MNPRRPAFHRSTGRLSAVVGICPAPMRNPLQPMRGGVRPSDDDNPPPPPPHDLSQMMRAAYELR